MTNRQSNIIFYSVISLIIYALIINHFYPEYFENFTKSKAELSIKVAMDDGEHGKALAIYQQLLEKKIEQGNESSLETAAMYEEMANLYSLLGNKSDEKNYYVMSLNIKEKLKKVDRYSFANTYEKLGEIAEENREYDQAQLYYEKSLSHRLGDTEKDEDEGMITGMHQSRLNYIRLNNEATITTFKKLAKIHNIKKEYAIAKNYYEKALTASKLTFGEDDAKTLEIMHLVNSIRL